MRYSRLSCHVALFLVAFVSSLPIYEDGQRPVARLQVETRSDPEDWPSKGKLKKMMRTKKDQATFWTGRRGGASAEVAAEADALERGGQTLGMTLCKGGVKIPPRGWKWDQASTYFSKGAAGSIHAHIGDLGTVRPDGYYEVTEKPALLKNPKVTSITEHHSDGSVTVIQKEKASKMGCLFCFACQT